MRHTLCSLLICAVLWHLIHLHRVDQVSAAPLEVEELIDCQTVMLFWENIDGPTSELLKESADDEAEALDLISSVPKPPQVRLRSAHPLDEPTLSQARIGLRWYLPSLGSSSSDISDPQSLFEEQARVMILSRQLRGSMAHLDARSLWVEYKYHHLSLQIKTAERSILRQLQSSGMSTSLALEKINTEFQIAQLKADQAQQRWSARSTMINRIKISETRSSRGVPLIQTCIDLPQSKDELQNILDLPGLRSLEELKLGRQLIRFNVEDQARSGLFDFIEVGYDRGRDSHRIVAEVGVDLPGLNGEERLRSLAQAQAKQRLQHARFDRQHRDQVMRDRLSHHPLSSPETTPSEDPTLPELTQIPLLQIAQLKLDLWREQWRARLTIERDFVNWISTREPAK